MCPTEAKDTGLLMQIGVDYKIEQVPHTFLHVVLQLD